MLPALHPQLPVQLLERDALMGRLLKIDPSEVANFKFVIVSAREIQSLLDRARQELNSLLPASRDAISYHPNLSAKEVVVRFRGLACLRWHQASILARGMQKPNGILARPGKWNGIPGNCRRIVIHWRPIPGAGWSFSYARM